MSTVAVTPKKETFLDKVGQAFKAVFHWLGSAQGQTVISSAETAATVAAGIAAPEALPALTGIEALVNAGLKSVISTETLAAAAASQQGSGAQKLAAVVSAVSPNVKNFLDSIGIKDPTAAQVEAVSTALANGLVAILNAIPAPAPSTAPSTSAS